MTKQAWWGGGRNYSSNPFATSTLEGSGWLKPCPGCFTPRKTPVPTVQGDGFGLVAGLEGHGKFRAHRYMILRP
jgi:hypothetical protein